MQKHQLNGVDASAFIIHLYFSILLVLLRNLNLIKMKNNSPKAYNAEVLYLQASQSIE